MLDDESVHNSPKSHLETNHSSESLKNFRTLNRYYISEFCTFLQNYLSAVNVAKVYGEEVASIPDNVQILSDSLTNFVNIMSSYFKTEELGTVYLKLKLLKINLDDSLRDTRAVLLEHDVKNQTEIDKKIAFFPKALDELVDILEFFCIYSRLGESQKQPEEEVLVEFIDVADQESPSVEANLEIVEEDLSYMPAIIRTILVEIQAISDESLVKIFIDLSI